MIEGVCRVREDNIQRLGHLDDCHPVGVWSVEQPYRQVDVLLRRTVVYSVLVHVGMDSVSRRLNIRMRVLVGPRATHVMQLVLSQ